MSLPLLSTYGELDFLKARDEMHTLFKNTWEANPASANVQVLYQDAAGDIPQEEDEYGNPTSWARITVQHNTGGQASLANHGGRKKFRREGIVTVQIFTPRGTGLLLADNFYRIAMDAFEGKRTPGGIWFRNVRLNEIGPDGAWFQGNVLADFQYDEIKH